MTAPPLAVTPLAHVLQRGGFRPELARHWLPAFSHQEEAFRATLRAADRASVSRAVTLTSRTAAPPTLLQQPRFVLPATGSASSSAQHQKRFDDCALADAFLHRLRGEIKFALNAASVAVSLHSEEDSGMPGGCRRVLAIAWREGKGEEGQGQEQARHQPVGNKLKILEDSSSSQNDRWWRKKLDRVLRRELSRDNKHFSVPEFLQRFAVLGDGAPSRQAQRPREHPSYIYDEQERGEAEAADEGDNSRRRDEGAGKSRKTRTLFRLRSPQDRSRQVSSCSADKHSDILAVCIVRDGVPAAEKVAGISAAAPSSLSLSESATAVRDGSTSAAQSNFLASPEAVLAKFLTQRYLFLSRRGRLRSSAAESQFAPSIAVDGDLSAESVAWLQDRVADSENRLFCSPGMASSAGRARAGSIKNKRRGRRCQLVLRLLKTPPPRVRDHIDIFEAGTSAPEASSKQLLQEFLRAHAATNLKEHLQGRYILNQYSHSGGDATRTTVTGTSTKQHSSSFFCAPSDTKPLRVRAFDVRDVTVMRESGFSRRAAQLARAREKDRYVAMQEDDDQDTQTASPTSRRPSLTADFVRGLAYTSTADAQDGDARQQRTKEGSKPRRSKMRKSRKERELLRVEGGEELAVAKEESVANGAAEVARDGPLSATLQSAMARSDQRARREREMNQFADLEEEARRLELEIAALESAIGEESKSAGAAKRNSGEGGQGTEVEGSQEEVRRRMFGDLNAEEGDLPP